METQHPGEWTLGEQKMERTKKVIMFHSLHMYEKHMYPGFWCAHTDVLLHMHENPTDPTMLSVSA